MNEKSSERKTAICAECQSEYFSDSSVMQALCPDCAHWLYGHANCRHQFDNGRFIFCYWNGTSSDYIMKLKTE